MYLNILKGHQKWMFIDIFFLFDSQSRGSHWLPLYDWQTATVWVQHLPLCSTEETKSPTSWMLWGWADKHTIFIFGWTIPLSVICMHMHTLKSTDKYSL